MDIFEQALELHKKYGGKITTGLRDIPDSQSKLSAYYSPGVARVSEAIYQHPEKLRDYTWTNNLVAVISDGSAVLGLGNIGGKASMPVMEGKAMLFKHFADIDSVPIVLDVHEPEEIISAVKAIAHSFGAINLEDIAAPKCFEIENRLKEELDIPVFHDDQHGTAIIVLAGLINAMKVTGRNLADCKIAIMGAGASGASIAGLLQQYAGPEVLMLDSKGIISSSRENLSPEKQNLLEITNPNDVDGGLEDALKNADIFIGVSKGDLLNENHIAMMAEKPVVFALANPYPEITPELAKESGVAVIATGRSDYPNQVNNALAFPGVFRGALDNRVRDITDKHKLAAAEAIAAIVENPSAEYVIPTIDNDTIVKNIAEVIR